MFFVCCQHHIYSFCPISTFLICPLSPYHSVKCTACIFHFQSSVHVPTHFLQLFPLIFRFSLCTFPQFFQVSARAFPIPSPPRRLSASRDAFCTQSPLKKSKLSFSPSDVSPFFRLFCLNRYSFFILRAILFFVPCACPARLWKRIQSLAASSAPHLRLRFPSVFRSNGRDRCRKPYERTKTPAQTGRGLPNGFAYPR